MTTTTRPLVLNVTEAGNLLGVGRSTAYELVRSGELDSVRLRRRVVVPVIAVANRLGMTLDEVWAATHGGPSTTNRATPSHDRPGLEHCPLLSDHTKEETTFQPRPDRFGSVIGGNTDGGGQHGRRYDDTRHIVASWDGE